MSEQLALVPEPEGVRHRPVSPPADVPLAQERPVARVLVETSLAHLDRPFDYLVPAALADDARPGARVRVRLAGRDRDGIVLERVDEADHTGRLAPLRAVVSPEPVLSPHVAAEIRMVADHYGGTAADVLRLAVPPRHARAERSVPPPAQGRPHPSSGRVVEHDVEGERGGDEGAPAVPTGTGTGEAWAAYPAGAAFLRRVGSGSSPAASWLALPGRPPGRDWPDAVAEAVQATVEAGRGALVVVPDHRDVQRLLAPVLAAVGPDSVVQLTADLGPEARYSAFLRVLRGHARVVVGTRSAAFAPVVDLGLLVCWDEGDDLHQEPRAPYPHVREVLRLRAAHEGAALLLGGFTRSVVVQRWVREGWVASVAAAPATVRAATPAVVVAGEGWQEARDEGARTARIPSLAWRALKQGLAHGPVLVQVPRHGYVVSLACQDCRTPVPCTACGGPMGAPAPGAAARCRWCGMSAAPDLPCARCGSRRRRATGVGERRTAEELGRAFPGVLVRTSGGDRVLAEIDPEPALVVATPGAEPWCRSGYAAVALLDGSRLLERASIDAQAEALRRWCTAAALVRAPTGSGPGGGPPVVLCGVPPHAGLPAVEALVRWDPAWLAARELEERSELGLPPVRRYATVTGPAPGVAEAARELSEAGHDVVGIRELVRDGTGAGGQAAATVRESLDAPSTLAAAVHAVRARRSARKARESVRIALDDVDASA
jgi:primosomal protein N' (replication factor Y)